MEKDDITAEEIADETDAGIKAEKTSNGGENDSARSNEGYEGEIQVPKAKNEELVSDLKRLQAQFENYQKRVEKEKAQMRDSGKQEVLAKMVSLADEFDAACSHMHNSSESELRNGIRLLQKKLMSLLEDEGVKPIECIGRKFSQDSCDAVELVESGEGEDGIVVKEMRRGYSHNGKVLRHAMVGVTKVKGKTEDEKKQ
jgi:molecular chaperone GrpE